MKAFDNLLDKIERTFSLNHITFLVCLGYLLYAKSLMGEFLWDDLDQIANNPIIQQLQNIPYLFTHSTFYSAGTGLIGLYYRPLMMTVFSFTYQLWGLNTFGYHLFSVTLHIVNTVLFFYFLKRVLKIEHIHIPQTAAFIASLFFLIHPTHVESVAYISATSEVLYAFFLLVSLHLALKYGFSTKRNFKYLLSLSVAILLSLFSKEAGIVTVFLVLILAFFYFRKKFTLILLASLIPVGIYSVFRFVLAHFEVTHKSTFIPIAQASFLQRLLTIPYELFSYARIILFPKDLYIGQQQVIQTATDQQFIISIIVVLLSLIVLSILLFRNRSKLALFFLVWFALSLLPVLNIIPLDYTVEERWLYVPLMGMLGFAAIIIPQLLTAKRSPQKLLLVGVLSIFILFFSMRTMERTGDWVNEVTLYKHDIVYAPHSVELHTNYGTALYRAGNRKASEEEYLKVLQIAPNNFFALNNLGSLYAIDGQYEKAKPLYTKAIQLSPTIDTYENLAQIYFFTEKPQQVIPFLKQALTAFPDSAKLNQLAALSYQATGEIGLAKTHAEKSAVLNPTEENTASLRVLLEGK